MQLQKKGKEEGEKGEEEWNKKEEINKTECWHSVYLLCVGHEESSVEERIKITLLSTMCLHYTGKE